MSDLDYSNPLNRASLYLEDLKYGVGPRQIEEVSRNEMRDQLVTLLDEGKISTITADEILDTVGYYGWSNGRSYRIPELIAVSIFMDGLTHGLALAGGLGREPTDQEKEEWASPKPPEI